MCAQSISFDLAALPDTFYADPYPEYHRLRQAAPVLRLADGSFFLTRYADLRMVYRDPRQFSSDKRLQFAPVFGAESPLYQHHTTSLVFNDPPLHTRVRKAIGNALSARVVEEMQPGLEALVEELLDGLAGRGRVDAIAEFAAAIPVEIIGNLLAMPKDERGPLRDWSLAILGGLEVGLTPAQQAAGNAAVVEFLAYLRELIKLRRRSLSAQQDDIVARLLRWRDADGGLSAEQLYHQCIFLLNAGHETTTNLIGNGIELLLRHPRALQRIQAEPQLMASAVEEMLRYESSNQLGNRTTTRAVTLSGVQIPAQSVLTLCIGAANRDPEVFAEPDRFDITRTPNPHLAFAAGIHTCAGLNVARLEGRVALQMFFRRFPGARLCAEPQRARRARFRGFASLPVAPAG